MMRSGFMRRQMARSAQQQSQYLLEEPATGLYISFSPHRIQITARAAATRYSTGQAAFIEAGARLQGQPCELVRVDG